MSSLERLEEGEETIVVLYILGRILDELDVETVNNTEEFVEVCTRVCVPSLKIVNSCRPAKHFHLSAWAKRSKCLEIIIYSVLGSIEIVCPVSGSWQTCLLLRISQN